MIDAHGNMPHHHIAKEYCTRHNNMLPHNGLALSNLCKIIELK